MWELWSGGKTPYPAFTNPQVLDEVRTKIKIDLLILHVCLIIIVLFLKLLLQSVQLNDVGTTRVQARRT